MPFTFRKRLRIGPLVLNFSERGFTSWGLKAGRLSWNAGSRQTSVDLPGPVNYRTRRRSRRTP
jgi:hypothetical protein